MPIFVNAAGGYRVIYVCKTKNNLMTMIRNGTKTNRFKNSICLPVMIGDNPTVMSDVLDPVVELIMSSINFINSKGNSNENHRYSNRYLGSNRCFCH